MRALVAVVVVAGCGTTSRVALPAAAPAPAPGRASLHGAVRDVAGQPLAGATVVAARDGRTYEAVAGETGQYEIGDLPAGDYDVVVHDDDTVELHASLHVEDRSQYDVVLPRRTRSMQIVVSGRHCARLRRLSRGRARFACYRSDVDRAMREVDQSPRQLRGGGRRQGSRPPR